MTANAVMAAPIPWHQHVRIALYNTLRRACTRSVWVTGQVEVRLAGLLRRNPDVLVVYAAELDRRVPRVLPWQVVLAIEVVGAGSETADRYEKPRGYAHAG